jgi:hypothetical protein
MEPPSTPPATTRPVGAGPFQTRSTRRQERLRGRQGAYLRAPQYNRRRHRCPHRRRPARPRRHGEPAAVLLLPRRVSWGTSTHDVCHGPRCHPLPTFGFVAPCSSTNGPSHTDRPGEIVQHHAEAMPFRRDAGHRGWAQRLAIPRTSLGHQPPSPRPRKEMSGPCAGSAVGERRNARSDLEKFDPETPPTASIHWTPSLIFCRLSIDGLVAPQCPSVLSNYQTASSDADLCTPIRLIKGGYQTIAMSRIGRQRRRRPAPNVGTRDEDQWARPHRPRTLQAPDCGSCPAGDDRWGWRLKECSKAPAGRDVAFRGAPL